MSLRQTPSDDLLSIYREFSSALTKSVDLGAFCLEEWVLPSLKGEEWEIAAVIIYRDLLEKLDGVSVLAEQACVESLMVVLRTVFEGYLSLGYVLREKTRERGLAYLYSLSRDYDSDLAELGIQDPELLPPPLSNVYAPAMSEWKRVWKKLGRPKHLNWFSLFPSKPGQEIKNVKELARHLGYESLYRTVYGLGSRLVHSKYNMHLAAAPGGTTLITCLRNPEHLQQLVAASVTLCQNSTRLMVMRYAPDRLVDFEHLSSQEVQPGLDMLTGPPRLSIEGLFPG